MPLLKRYLHERNPKVLHRMQASCLGKKELDQASAERDAERLRAKGEAVRAYVCRFCESWHVGHRGRIISSSA